MYESIRGALTAKSPHEAIVECSGLSYRIQIPLSTYTGLPAPHASVILYLSQVIREDAHTLHGFHTREDRDLFELLLSISGIGPKTAAGIVGHMDSAALQQAIGAGDVHLLSKLPGIGKKTAERLILELRDKFRMKGAVGKPLPLAGAPSVTRDAVNALIHLGYSLPDAEKAVQKAVKDSDSEPDLGSLITLSLKKL